MNHFIITSKRFLADQLLPSLLQSLGVIIAWVTLYQFNMWAFKSLAINPFVSWIFLPAFIRMLSVLLFGWAGVIGLIVGAVITSPTAEIDHSLSLAFISGLAPMLAFKICQYFLKLSDTLEGIKSVDLLILALSGSTACVAFNGLYFAQHNLPANLATCLLPMLLGDMLGSLIMLYLAAIFLRTITHLHRQS